MSFVLPKLIWMIANPGNLYFFGIAGGIALLWSRWRRFAHGWLVAMLVTGVLIGILPLGTWLVIPLEDRFPAPARLPPHVDGIVVLGGAINPVLSQARGQPALNENAERLISFVDLARRHPEARLVFTGGSGNIYHQDVAEADSAREIFRQAGLDPDRVTYERASRNTYENVVMTRDLMRPSPGETWVLVTSARHLPRAIGVFRKVGWRVLPYPVDYTTTGHATIGPGFNFAGGLSGVNWGLREWLGLASYAMMGRTDEFFPGPGSDGSGS